MSEMVTRGRWRTWRPRRWVFVEWATGQWATQQENGCIGTGTAARRLPLAGLLGLADDVYAERIYVTGPRIEDSPDAFRAWFNADPGCWQPSLVGHYLENLDAHVLRFFTDAGLPRSVEILRAAGYFGEGTDSPLDHARAYVLLGEAVGRRFPGGQLLSSPATTGRDLFARSLGDREYPVASAEHQELIRSTTGQGRIELVAEPGSELPGLVEYDGRLMYGALCWGLGSGVVADYTAVTADQQSPLLASFRADWMLRARYQIRWCVPSGWSHVGLIGAWDGQRWTYPREPGQAGESWVDGAELRLLEQQGWPFAIVRRLVLGAQDGKPLDGWAKKLTTLRAELAGGGHLLAANGARAILIHAIGAFMGREHVVTRSAPVTEPGRVPATAVGLRVEEDTLVWGERMATKWPEMAHPEWSAAIWARCRMRLLRGPGFTGALHVPFSDVVGFKTDALYLTNDPGWADDGATGRLVRKSVIPGPLVAPATVHQLKRGYGR